MPPRRRAVPAGALALLLLGAGCGAGRDIVDAADGLRTASEEGDRLQARLDRAKGLTFTATYDVRTKDGGVEQVVVAQAPPRSAYQQGDQTFVDDGQRTYSCTAEAGQAQCLEVGSHAPDGAFGVGSGFGLALNPATFLGLYRAAAALPGVEAGRSTRTVAGQAAECVWLELTRGADAGKRYEGCTTGDGVLASSDDGEGTVVVLTRFERTVDEGRFRLPAPPRAPEALVADATSTTATTAPSTSSSTSRVTLDLPTTTSSSAPDPADPEGTSTTAGG